MNGDIQIKQSTSLVIFAVRCKMEVKLKEENRPKDSQQKKSSTKFNFNIILGLVAYVAIGFIAIAILLTLVFKSNSTVSNTFSSIGEAIAYIVSIIVAFSWVKTHRHVAWIVCYVVFVVTIVVLYILTI